MEASRDASSTRCSTEPRTSGTHPRLARSAARAARRRQLFPLGARSSCQGVEGAYSADRRLSSIFRRPIDHATPRRSTGVFRAVEAGMSPTTASFPLENSTAGSVNAGLRPHDAQHYVLRRAHHVACKVDHNLLALPGAELSRHSRDIQPRAGDQRSAPEFLSGTARTSRSSRLRQHRRRRPRGSPSPAAATSPRSRRSPAPTSTASRCSPPTSRTATTTTRASPASPRALRSTPARTAPPS